MTVHEIFVESFSVFLKLLGPDPYVRGRPKIRTYSQKYFIPDSKAHFSANTFGRGGTGVRVIVIEKTGLLSKKKTIPWVVGKLELI
jgi:hypothetical protein